MKAWHIAVWGLPDTSEGFRNMTVEDWKKVAAGAATGFAAGITGGILGRLLALRCSLWVRGLLAKIAFFGGIASTLNQLRIASTLEGDRFWIYMTKLTIVAAVASLFTLMSDAPGSGGDSPSAAESPNEASIEDVKYTELNFTHSPVEKGDDGFSMLEVAESIENNGFKQDKAIEVIRAEYDGEEVLTLANGTHRAGAKALTDLLKHENLKDIRVPAKVRQITDDSSMHDRFLVQLGRVMKNEYRAAHYDALREALIEYLSRQ
ncbi:hypothetical protein QUF75_17690 [Desulfococcaceae bacterium HSG7]|nr:hypothetical protein [Desulfococcaceae bacterium HSG7]